MNDALLMHRLHFGFTHYLFPQLTMGLAPLSAEHSRDDGAIARSERLPWASRAAPHEICEAPPVVPGGSNTGSNKGIVLLTC